LRYIVLQDEEGIIAATPGVHEMTAMAADKFLEAGLVQTRTTRFNNQEVLEVVSPFGVNGGDAGILRIGLHLDEIRALEKRMIQRAVTISIVIIFIGFISISAVLISQNYAFLKQEHALIQTYTGNILHAMSDAVFGVDTWQSIKFANRAALRMLHCDQNQITGQRFADFFTDCRSIVTALEKKQKIENVEQTLHIKALNQSIFVSLSVSFVMGETGEMDTGVILLRDQTKQRQMEEQIHRQEKLTAMGEFASGVAHEIRNPLNAISMIVQRFQKEFEPKSDPDEYFAMTRTVRSEIDRIGQIIRQFLEFARPAKLNKTPMAVDEIIMQSVNVISAQAEAKHIRMVTGNDVKTVINVDKNQLHQALLNLMQNALEAVDEGGTIAISARPADQKICIKVQDDGAGIPLDQQKRIFDLYFTSKPTGTGLGLALVHRIVTEHGGEVAVQSKAGEGTTFTLTIPIKDPQSSRSEDEHSNHR
jgi:signal transduction histidine kinase